MIVYLAGPITGCSYKECTDWRKTATNTLGAFNIKCLDPMRGKSFLENADDIRDEYGATPTSNRQSITYRDHDDIRRADIVLVNFSGATRVSIGTVIEIGWASELNKLIVVIMDEDNCHWHGMLRELAYVTVPDLKTAINIIREVS
jgi:nucleoside 2-deoxyribosyltransferase